MRLSIHVVCSCWHVLHRERICEVHACPEGQLMLCSSDMLSTLSMSFTRSMSIASPRRNTTDAATLRGIILSWQSLLFWCGAPSVASMRRDSSNPATERGVCQSAKLEQRLLVRCANRHWGQRAHLQKFRCTLQCGLSCAAPEDHFCFLKRVEALSLPPN